ncbi:hypothetical protein KC349_g5542 [Hortaea werneckii]|nr:hypothetical protein KC349_g5542 [Hortaea werneckii]
MAAGFAEFGLKRLYPAKYEFGRKSMRSPKDVSSLPAKDTQAKIGFDIFLDRMNRKMSLQAEARQHGIQAAVLEIAVQGTKNSSLKMQYWHHHQQQKLSEDEVDAWTERLKQCYKHCYSHPIALTKVISTTTANAPCVPLRKNFASGQYGQEVKGVTVIADEASVVHLKEQNRMHPDLAESVNKYIYKGSLRNALATQRTLRHHMESIWPKRHGLSGDKLSADVFAIVASREDGGHVLVAHRSSMCHPCGRQSMWHYQGREALMMFLGLAAQKVDSKADVGFVKAISRVNVALTHGRDVFEPPAVALKAD